MANEHDKAELLRLRRFLAQAESGQTEIADWDGAKGDPQKYVELLRGQIAEYEALCGDDSPDV